MTIQDQIITEARRWIGTRFLHQGRRRRGGNDAGGVDCLGLLIGVAKELSLTDRSGAFLASHDKRDYSRQPDGDNFKAQLSELLTPCRPRPGGVGLFDFDGQSRHVAFFGVSKTGLTMIHAYAPAKRVVEHAFDESWQRRLVASYRLSEPDTENELGNGHGGKVAGQHPDGA